ncbi:MAG TPA: hypothetical protein V6C57_06235 [Coleofasciculaceae cyanobacterium]
MAQQKGNPTVACRLATSLDLTLDLTLLEYTYFFYRLCSTLTL